jgi:hypothetical protein
MVAYVQTVDPIRRFWSPTPSTGQSHNLTFVIESAHGRQTIALMQWSCFLSHYQKLSKMIEDLRSSIQVGDYIKFLWNNASNNSDHNNAEGLGKVIHCNAQSVKVKLFHPMD